MFAVVSDPRDPIWMGVHRVSPAAWRLIQARPRRRIWVVEGEDEAVTAYVRIDGHRTTLDVGTYSPITRVDDIPTTRVGLDVRVNMVACEPTGGSVTIHSVEANSTRIQSLRASFEQLCGSSRIRGCISYTAP